MDIAKQQLFDSFKMKMVFALGFAMGSIFAMGSVVFALTYGH